MYRTIAAIMCTVLVISLSEASAFDSKDLSFSDVIKMVRSDNIEVKLSHLNIESNQGNLIQEGLWWNPEFEMEYENFGGEGQYKDENVLEKTFVVSQKLDFFGKKALQKETAKLGVKFAQKSFSQTEKEVLSKASNLYAQVLVAQNKVELSKRRVTLLEQMLESAQKRVSAGKASPIEKMRIESVYAHNKIEILENIQELKTEQRKLEALWNHQHIHFDTALGNIENIPLLRPLNEIEESVLNNFIYQKSILEKEKLKNILALEKRKRWPDVVLGGGIRDFNETDEHAYVASLSFSIPVFDRNQGNIQRAKSEYEESRLSLEMLKTQIDVEFHDKYDYLDVLSQKIEVLKQEIRPMVDNSLELARQGYGQGRFSYLEVLDAEKNHYDIQEEIWTYSLEYIQKFNELMLFIGQDPYLFDINEKGSIK